MKHFSILFFLIFFIFQSCDQIINSIGQDLFDNGGTPGNPTGLQSYSWNNNFRVYSQGRVCPNATITVCYEDVKNHPFQSTYHADEEKEICCVFWQRLIPGTYTGPIDTADFPCVIYADHDNPDSKFREDSLRFFSGTECPTINTIIILN